VEKADLGKFGNKYISLCSETIQSPHPVGALEITLSSYLRPSPPFSPIFYIIPSRSFLFQHFY